MVIKRRIAVGLDVVRGYVRSPLGPGVRDRIAFVHIPKCAGTSLSRAIGNTFRLPPHRESAAFMHIASEPSLHVSEVLQIPLMKYREYLLLYALANDAIRYVTGHFTYSERAMETFGDRWSFVTVLRDPVNRWISHYFFNRYKTSDHFGISADLTDYVDSEQGRSLGRFYVDKLTDPERSVGLSESDATRQAIHNLDRFALVGRLEDMNRFAGLFEERFGERPKLGRRHKPNPMAADKRDALLTPEVRAKIEKICEPDREVYEAAKARLCS